MDEAGHSLKEIVHSIKKVSDIVAEIAAASAEQTTGIDQVNNAIAQMEALTQDNVSLVERAATASESMSEQAKGMKGLVSFFSVEGVDLSAEVVSPSTESSAAPKIARSGSSEAQPTAVATKPASISAQPVSGGDSEWAEF